LARKSKAQIIEEKVKFVSDFREDTDRQTMEIKRKWRENYLQFKNGSTFPEKDEWMSNISSGKFETRIRAAAGKARDILINNPDWFDLEPAVATNEQAEQLAPIIKKATLYFLRKAKFPKKVSTVLLSAFISMGSVMVGWTRYLVQNPKHVLQRNKTMREEEQQALAGKVENTQATFDATPDMLFQQVQDALNSLPALISGEPEQKEPEEKPYLQFGGLDLRVINPENRYWDTGVQYLDESGMGSHVEHQPLWKIKHLAEQGFFDKKEVDKITPNKEDYRMGIQRSLYSDLSRSRPNDVVDLTYYFGPLIIDDVVEKERWGCIVAEGQYLIKEWEDYPYWEPPTHEATPYVDTAVKEVPWRATGAGVGDNAVKLARMHDSNINLMNDAMRFNTIGFNIIDTNSLVEPDQIEDGLEPGVTLKVRKAPKDVYQHINITSNVERQWDPVNQKIEDAIDDQMGMSRLELGGPTQRSRTTAAEIQAQSQGADARINNIAMDLEQTFLIPFLEKVVARVLQFGLDEINTNPEFAAIFSEDEKRIIAELSPESRLEALNQFFVVRVKGFSAQTDKQAKLAKLNEFLAIASAGGPVGQVTNPVPLVEEMAKLMELDEGIQGLTIPNTEAEQIILENQLLALDRFIEPNEQDNHEMHLESHMQDSQPTQAKQAHIQMHQQILQQLQMAQQQSQGLSLPPPSDDVVQ
jgi:hypothetical protein